MTIPLTPFGTQSIPMINPYKRAGVKGFEIVSGPFLPGPQVYDQNVYMQSCDKLNFIKWCNAWYIINGNTVDIINGLIERETKTDMDFFLGQQLIDHKIKYYGSSN